MKSILVASLVVVPGLLHAADFSIPSNLHPEGFPPIPLAVAEESAPYDEYRTATLLAWHPSNREMLISTRFANTPQIHRVLMPGGDRTQLTFFPDRTGDAWYSPVSSDTFVFSRDIGGGEFYQLYRFDLKTQRSTLLTDGKSRNQFVQWSPSGTRIAFSSTRRNGRDSDIWVMDPMKPDSARLLMQNTESGWSSQSWSADEKTLLVTRSISAEESMIFEVDTTTGARTALTPTAPQTRYASPRFSADGQGAYLLTTENSDFERLAYMDLGSKKITPLSAGINWDVEEFDVSKDGRYIAYIVNEDARGVLHLMDASTRKDVGTPALPPGTVTGVKWHRNGKDLGFTVASSRTPSDVYSLDVRSGKVDRWTSSETGGVDTSDFREAEIIHWKGFDGLTISGLYYRPPGRFTGPRPVIVNIHGGPESQARPGYLGSNNYLINELGVAMIYPNVRGSSGYGKTFLSLDNGMKREDSVKDIGVLLDWIATQRDLDASRVMVMGGSYGGYMTLASMTHYNDRLRCAIDVVGISNWVSFLEHTEAYRRDLRRVEYGDERDPKMRDFLATISPRANAKNFTKPMMIVAGKNDPRVPFTEGEQMAAAIKSNGGTVSYLLADDEGHGYVKKANRDFQFFSTVVFIQKFLLESAK
jgi:dipeptidyl aminopeptidase/acylaminoacyl peptidase